MVSCVPWRRQLHHHRRGRTKGGNRGQALAERPEPSQGTRPEPLAGPPPSVPSAKRPPGLIPVPQPPRPQNSGGSLLGPRSQLHPRAPPPLAPLPTHTAQAPLPPRRPDRRCLATARMRPTPAVGRRHLWRLCLSSEQRVLDLAKCAKTPLPSV